LCVSWTDPYADDAFVAAEAAAEAAAAKVATAGAVQAAAAAVVREDGPDAPFTAAMRAEATGEPAKRAGLFGAHPHRSPKAVPCLRSEI